MNKKEEFIDWIENMVGHEIIDYNIKPKYDDEGNLLSYDIMVQPKMTPQYLEIQITTTPADKTIESYE